MGLPGNLRLKPLLNWPMQPLPLLFWKLSLKLGPEKHNTYFTLQSWYAQTGL
jgi:hypothetical protein